MKTDQEFDEIAYIKQFTALSSVLWIQTIIVHPNNSLYLDRLYFILGLTLSVPEKEFGKKEMNYNDVKYLFDSIDEPYSKTFLMFEDFAGFDQSKLIPFFLDHRKYYFFYGNFERPYEHLKQFKDQFLFDERSYDTNLLKLKSSFIESLEFQTALLENLKFVSENKFHQEKLYVPSEDYYKVVASHFKISNALINAKDAHKIGEFSKLSPQQIGDKSIAMVLFKRTYINIEREFVWLIPHVHLNIFINEGRKLLRKEPVLLEALFSNYRSRLNLICRSFFSKNKETFAILKKGSDQNLLKGTVDFATIVDSNKLLLFSCVDYSYDYDITKVLNEKTTQLNRLREALLAEDILGILDIDHGNEVYGIHVKALEIWLIPVYESLCLDIVGSVKKDQDTTQFFPFCINDLSAVFDKIEKPLDFLKFIKEDNALRERMDGPLLGEFMDRFYFFLSNGKSHMRTARQFGTGVFEFHMWSDFIFNELWEKYQDNAYEEIGTKTDNYYNRIQNYKPRIYRMVNTGDLIAAYLLKFKDRFIWLYLPPIDKLEFKEFHIGAELVAPMISEYMVMFEQEFKNYFEGAGIDSLTEVFITVVPKSIVKAIPEFSFFEKQVEGLDADNPITFSTQRVKYNRIRIAAIYDYQLFPKLFSQPQNIGERYSIKMLVKSIIEFNKNNATTSEELAEKFINEKMPIGIKGYSVEEYHVTNPNLNDYQSPIQLNETEIGVTERLISEYLIKNNIKPGDYKKEEAKEINYRIYTFLQDKLEKEIAKFNNQFMNYAYKQLELAEGERHLGKITLGMKSKGRTDYDILEATKESENKGSRLNLCIKHIVHTALKVELTGSAFVTGETWTKLTSIADAIMIAANIYDYIEYDLRDHILRITNDYLIKDIAGEEVIDSEKLRIKHTEIKIERAKKAHTKALQDPTQNIPKQDEKSENHKALDEAFNKDLGFSFDDFVFVLYSLSILPLSDDAHFPITIRSTKELFNEIKKTDTRDSITEEAVGLILIFLCLYNGIYKSTNLLYPSDMMRNKERINVSPFIKLDDNLFLYGNEAVRVSFNFWSSLSIGDFPFVNTEYANIKKVIENIHRKEDLALEKLAEEKAISILGRDNVEARIKNFTRLSDTFKREEDCGEIDVLCINRELKKIYVIDCKNINKKLSLYHVKKSIKDFFEGNKCYYSKLLKKKQFVKDNLSTILQYFKVNDTRNWKVKEAFVSEEVYFAAYYNKINVDFILVDDLDSYFNNSGKLS